jgi:hypothetical protein
VDGFPYRAAIGFRMQIVIIFNATYPALDPDLPACSSRAVYGASCASGRALGA